jgi:hypothetical protein
VQDDGGWSVVPEHDTAAPHGTLARAWVQAPAPLQVPVLPQTPLAAHWPAGAAVPAAIAVHVPVPLTLHTLQVPQLVLPAASWQQTPSTQAPLMHWLPAVQAVPGGFSAQLRLGAVPWQVFGDRQCESIAQFVRQVSPPQT